MTTDAPNGWTVWTDEPDGRRTLTYRPDVFDSQAFPAPCLPTIHCSPTPHSRRRPEQRHDGTDRSSAWYVTLFLEPEVVVTEERHGSRTEAVTAAEGLARRFARGDLDYRSAYRNPREAYLDRLDELTGRDA